MSATLSRRAYLGAVLPDDTVAFSSAGMRIDDVVPDSMAERAGLRHGDVVRAIGGMPVRSLAELAAALRHAGGYDQIEIAMLRDAAAATANVSVVPAPREQIAGASVEYGANAVAGATLRTIATRTPSPKSLIVTLQGIACESVDHDGAFAGAIAEWTQAGHDTLRFDKRGVGDSEGGPCPTTDFTTELRDARAVVAHARDQAAARGVPLVLFGHSVGGIIAPLLACDIAPAAVIVYGTPVLPWLACLKDSTRRQLALRGAPEAEIASRVAALDELKQRGELNGRSAAYHAQLDEVDIATAWRGVTAPVLVVRGEHDWVVDADDQARIATLAEGPTEIVDLAGLDHLLGWHPDRDASLRDYGAGEIRPVFAERTLAWLDRLRSTR
jgi:alpha-beta hydrolase superfamily lysophospholipase